MPLGISRGSPTARQGGVGARWITSKLSRRKCPVKLGRNWVAEAAVAIAMMSGALNGSVGRAVSHGLGAGPSAKLAAKSIPRDCRCPATENKTTSYPGSNKET